LRAELRRRNAAAEQVRVEDTTTCVKVGATVSVEAGRSK
jgi:hypothetical protein